MGKNKNHAELGSWSFVAPFLITKCYRSLDRRSARKKFFSLFFYHLWISTNYYNLHNESRFCLRLLNNSKKKIIMFESKQRNKINGQICSNWQKQWDFIRKAEWGNRLLPVIRNQYFIALFPDTQLLSTELSEGKNSLIKEEHTKRLHCDAWLSIMPTFFLVFFFLFSISSHVFLYLGFFSSSFFSDFLFLPSLG